MLLVGKVPTSNVVAIETVGIGEKVVLFIRHSTKGLVKVNRDHDGRFEIILFNMCGNLVNGISVGGLADVWIWIKLSVISQSIDVDVVQLIHGIRAFGD